MKKLAPILFLFPLFASAQTVWKTTIAEGRYLSATILLTKTDGSIITIPDPWKLNIRQEGDKINIIYPDSTRVIYRIGKKLPEPEPEIQSSFGFMQEGANQLKDMQSALSATGLSVVRVPVFYHDNYRSLIADEYLKNGYKVQLNFNYKPTATKVLFPTDTAFIRSKAEQFFQYYLPYKDQVPVVCVENEWDNANYRDFTKTSIQDYLKELAIVTEVGHKYGFKIADGGITNTALGRWTWTRLDDADKKEWQQNYFVGQGMDNFQPVIDMVNAFAEGVKSIPIDYLNFHWYNNKGCNNGLQTALEHYRRATSKNIAYITNEFGVRDTSHWACTVEEVKAVTPVIGIAYSGNDKPELAVKLSTEMLELLIK